MRGLEKRKGSNNWQGRFRIPKHLWERRDELVRLGVKDISGTQEFKKSLGTPNQREAERLYRDMQTQWDDKMGAWEALLRDGRATLSEKQQWALAADHAKAFLAEFDDSPSEAPPAPPIPALKNIDDRTWQAVLDGLSPSERQSLARDLGEYLQATGAARQEKRVAVLKAYPAFAALIGQDLGRAFETMHGAETDNALNREHLAVDDVTRRLLNYRMAVMMASARRGLEQRAGGDYRPIDELENAPRFARSQDGQQHRPTTPSGYPALLELVDGWAEFSGAKPLTVRQNRTMVAKFIEFIGHDDPARITKGDVRQWRNSMMQEGRLATKTINDRYLVALKSVLAFAVKEHDLPENVAVDIQDPRDPPTSKWSQGYSDEQALTILRATFKGTNRKLDAHHRRALFWVPWILAFTGLRVSEVTQLQGQHVMEEGGVWFLQITPEDGSTKGNNAWNVALHRQVLGLGFVGMVKTVGAGPLFYEPYPTGTDLTALAETPRSKYSADRIRDWIRDDLGIAAPKGQPNHAWRHRFTTISRTGELNKEARDYMLGSQPKNDAREGYGKWLPADLAREINKLPDVDVEDTGWRP